MGSQTLTLQSRVRVICSVLVLFCQQQSQSRISLKQSPYSYCGIFPIWICVLFSKLPFLTWYVSIFVGGVSRSAHKLCQESQGAALCCTLEVVLQTLQAGQLIFFITDGGSSEQAGEVIMQLSGLSGRETVALQVPTYSAQCYHRSPAPSASQSLGSLRASFYLNSF